MGGRSQNFKTLPYKATHIHISPPMALPPAAPDRIPFSDHLDWKICNDNGFIYRRRCHPLQTPCQTLSSSSDLDLRRRRRTLKKRSLLSLRQKYSQELDHWKSLLHSSSAPSSSAATDNAAPPPLLLPSAPSKQPVIDELLLQAEAQEAVLRKLSELCDLVESMWSAAEEERFAKELVDLPIWGSPKALVDALQSL